MAIKKLTPQPLRVQCPAAGTATDHALTPTPGGSSTKSVQIVVVVHRKSSDALRLGIRLDHSADGRFGATYATILATTDPGTLPKSLFGDNSATTTYISEYIHPVIICSSSGASAEWADIEVYEIRKPF